MLPRTLIVVAALALAGCGTWFGGNDAAVVTAGASGDVVITTRADADARQQAQDLCAKKSRYARLLGAERLPAPDPANDEIRWRFACTT